MSSSFQKELTHVLELLKERTIQPNEALQKIRTLKKLSSKHIPEELTEENIYAHISSIIGFSLTPQAKKMSLIQLGMDSIFAARIIDNLNTTYGLKLSPPLIFEFSNLQCFVDYILHLKVTQSSSIEKTELSPLKSNPPLNHEEENFDLLWARCAGEEEIKPLIFLSGLGCKGDMIAKVRQPFSHNRGTWIYLPPGHAQERDLIPLGKIEDLIDHFQHFLSEHKISKPFHLIGWSLGGIIAQYYAGLYPEQVATLSIVSSSAKAIEESSLFSRSFEEFAFMKEKGITIAEDLFLILPSEYLGYYKNILSHFDCSKLAEKIQCPIHIINVSNDKIMHLKHQEDLKTFYPKAQITTLKQEDIGHFGIYTHHQVFTASLKSFLEKYDRAIL